MSNHEDASPETKIGVLSGVLCVLAEAVLNHRAGTEKLAQTALAICREFMSLETMADNASKIDAIYSFSQNLDSMLDQIEQKPN